MDSTEEHRQQKKEALERTSVLANERTYAAWVRTGLTAFATSIGFVGLLSGVLDPFTLRSVALILGLSSATFFLIAGWRYHHVGSRMVTIKTFGTPIWLLVGLSLILVVATIFVLFDVWITAPHVTLGESK